MPGTLVITNDFPPRIGGIEAFVAQVCALLDDVIVLTRDHPDGLAHDRSLPYPVVRVPGPLLPTPRTLRIAADLLRQHGATRLVFGAAAPLGLLAGALRRAGAERVLAMSHGHETWWARMPGTRLALRHIGSQVDAMSTISRYTHAAIAPALAPAARAAMVRLAPPVDTARFAPRTPPERPTVVAAGRFIAQKGFDTLVEAWSGVIGHWPDAPPELVLIGDGPERSRLEARAARLHPAGTVRFTGPVSHADVPALMAPAHVFALPVRTRFGGLNPEGFGLVFAEAAACGLAVVAGRSGGTVDTLLPGASGVLVESGNAGALTAVLIDLLGDLPRARAMGRRGRAHVERNFSPGATAATLRRVLGG